ncbi:MAG: aspartate-semialdehyde dehydrogenase [Planctomycetota bacterium]|jgi:aspartate-semialdehyde dehydrogenase
MLPATPTIAIAGATGAVGVELIATLERRNTPCGDLRLYASARSAGLQVEACGCAREILDLADFDATGIDVLFLCASGDVSRAMAREAVAAGCTVIDNSSAFRMADDVPLVVPEINGAVLDAIEGPALIANPNCSTIIALMAVTPLYRAAGVRRMVVSTYQAASGAGRAVMEELEQQARDHVAGRPYSQDLIGRPYLFNVFSHDSPVGDDGSNEEERKLVRETARIWNDPEIGVSATCVRVPVLRVHCEAINLTLRSPLGESEARAALADAPGVRIVDDRAANQFPEPIHAAEQDEVLVGRIRADRSQPDGMGLNLFVAGDQLRKGAALNAVQIAERLMARTPASA